MRLPIGYALAFPDRIGTAFGQMDWSSPTSFTFEPPNRSTFRCLDLAYAAGRSGGTAPAWLSAANEMAVEAFLAGRIGWSAIAALVDAAMQQWDASAAESLDAVMAADAGGRAAASRELSRGRFDLLGSDAPMPTGA